MMKNPCITLDHLSTGYRGQREQHLVSSDLSASLYQGELTCLLGANGAGKSTLLYTLSGFIPRSSGKITLLGKELSSYKTNQLAHVIAVVLTERCDLRNVSVFDMVALGRSPHTGFWGKLTATDQEFVTKTIRDIGIENLQDRMMHTLSDGERQKVMIAKALAQETPIIFLDEPTAFLDFPAKVEVMQLLARIAHTHKKSIFLSTHDLELALRIADKVWVLEKGVGLSVGTPEDLALNGTLQRFFQGRGVQFDAHTGLFTLEDHTTRYIALSGLTDNRREMVAKALSRYHIGVKTFKTEPNDEEQIEILSDQFIYHSKGEKYRASSIESLLNYILD